MAYVKRDSDKITGVSYLDGVPVKISEKYRAPRKVTLPLGYQQRCPVELLTEEYDFSLERQVLQHAESARKAKEAAERAQTESVGSAIEEFSRLLCLENQDPSKDPPDGKNWPWEGDTTALDEPSHPKSESPKPSGTTMLNIKSNDILKPTKPSSCIVSDKPDVTMTSTLNLEDFESESSPFDSVALHSLDDMEELKRVLQGDDHRDEQPRQEPPYAPPYMNGATVPLPYPSREDAFPMYPNISSWHGQGPMVGFMAPYPTAGPPQPTEGLAISTPDLLKELGTQRDRRRTASVAAPNPHRHGMGSTDTVEPSQSQQPWPSKTRSHESNCELGPEAAAMVKHISDMGFPRSRVTRAVHKLGPDGKKVVEHLCLVQSLVEKGYKAEQAEAALHLHSQNESQALAFLELMAQFRDLGFEEDVIKDALIRTNNDRDRALDFLVS